MKILFGVQGTGNGHISRCRTLARALTNVGADVQYIFSGRDPSQYFDMDVFGQYQTYQGMSFITQNGKINLRKTIQKIRAFRLIKDVRDLNLDEYDCIISDFEPVSAWAASHQHRECLGISNQSVCHYLHPKKYGLIANTIMRYYAPASKPIGLHWFHFGHPLIPPMIDPLNANNEGAHVVVYLPFEDLNEINQFLLPFKQYQFKCFHPDVKSPYQTEHMQFYPLSRTTFTDAINSCVGIITNTGFALISEALTIGKKILTKPVTGQFEQLYNAECLQQLNMATVMHKLDRSTLQQWLQEPSPSAIVYPDVATELANWIVSGQKEPLFSFSNRLWQQTIFPPHISARIKALGYAIK